MSTKLIDVARIDPDSCQPRKVFNQADLDELGASMLEHGQLQPVRVRYDRATRRYTLIMGERRWRAAKQVGILQLEAAVEHDVDDTTAFRKAVAENVNRADMSPLEEAEAFNRLVTEFGDSVADVAGAYGKSEEYVTYRIDLLKLVPAASEALAKRQMTVGMAWYVCRLSPAMQQTFLTKWARGEFASHRDAEAFAEACRRREAQQAEQGGFFVIEEMTPEQRQEVATRRRQVTSKVDRLGGAGEILAELAKADPAELAKVLAGADGGVGAYRARVEAIRDTAAKAAGTLRKAAAIAAAATLEVDPEVAC